MPRAMEYWQLRLTSSTDSGTPAAMDTMTCSSVSCPLTSSSTVFTYCGFTAMKMRRPLLMTSLLVAHGVQPNSLKTCLRSSEGSKAYILSADVTPLETKPRASASAICVIAKLDESVVERSPMQKPDRRSRQRHSTNVADLSSADEADRPIDLLHRHAACSDGSLLHNQRLRRQNCRAEGRVKTSRQAIADRDPFAAVASAWLAAARRVEWKLQHSGPGVPGFWDGYFHSTCSRSFAVHT